MEKETKETLFRELYQLDQEDTGEEDQSGVYEILRESRIKLSPSDVSARIPRDNIVHSLRPENSFLRTSTLSLHKSSPIKRSSFSSTVSLESLEQVIIDTPIMAKKIANMTAQKETSKATGKRKRGQSVELKPESQQIFNGLAFCGLSPFAALS